MPLRPRARDEAEVHPAAARYLATRLVVMYCGKLVETGACEAVYTEPLHPYTEALLSAALPLHPSARRQRIVLEGEIPNPRIRRRDAGFTYGVRARCPSARPWNPRGGR